MKFGKPITKEMISKFRKNYESDENAQMLTGVVAQNPLSELAFLPMKAASLKNSFSINVKTRGITNQKHSGRCWLFATMNTMRETVAEKCNLDKFEFSNCYGAFWDKFEKVNVYLEMAIATAKSPIDDRYVCQLIKEELGDGGYWGFGVNIVKKYGCVPDYIQPETYQSENTREILKYTNTLLRKDILELRELVNQGKDPQERKEEMLNDFFKAFSICFGEPVEQFDFEYTDLNGVAHCDHKITPLQFYEKYVGKNLDDYVTIMNAPTPNHPYNQCYTVKVNTNMIEEQLLFLNLEMPRLKELTLQQLKDNEITWFGCACGQSGSREAGVWDESCFDYGKILGGIDLSMSKAQLEMSYEAWMDHAMALTGVNLDENGQPNRWKIENSWGSEVGKNGYFVASDQWFDKYVFQCIINKKYLTENELKLLEQEPIELEPWDPAAI